MRARRLACLLTALTMLFAVGCGGGGGERPSGEGASAPTRGGKVVFAAEQWPQCLNPVTSCANISYLYWSVVDHVRPKAMALDSVGNWIASPLLTEAPTLDNGGIVAEPFSVTYHLDPNAVWADGTPITAADFDFTWKAIMHTTGSLVTVGYDKITSIEGPDAHTVVIHFSEVYVDWQDLFGGSTGGVMEKAAFPDADPETPDLRSAMNSSIPFSGGPWILQSWSKEQAVLVPNPKYWGPKPYFDQVTFVPREEQATEINSLLSGEVSVIFPQPSNVSIRRQLAGNPGVQVVSGPGPYFEALWFNVERPPLDDSAVRQALMYAIDRKAVIDAIVKLNDPDAAVLDCGALAYVNLGPWCQGPKGKPFAEYHYDPRHSIEILESAGYDCSAVASGGVCRKGGKDLTVEYATVAGNARRETTQALEIPKARAAGFRLVVRNYQSGDLFSNVQPKGQFGISDFAWGGSPDPSVMAILSCGAIATEKNGWSGQNANRWCNPEADRAMHAADAALDQNRRLELLQQVYALEASDGVLLPLYQLPQLTAWRADRIAGPVGKFNDSIQGAFWNMAEWYCARPGACQ